MAELDSNMPPGVQAAGLNAFFRILDAWSVTDEERRLLLGNPSRATLRTFKEGSPEFVTSDTLDRLSYVLGIHKALAILFSQENQVRWLKNPNQDTPFAGKSPLDHMLSGRIEAMREVRRYLDAACG